MHVRKWTHLARRVIPCQSCGAVIVAAGSARRTNRHCHPSDFDWTGLRRL